MLYLEVTEGARIKNLQFFDEEWIDVKIAENGIFGLVKGIEEEGTETFGKISIKRGECKVNNMFFEFSDEYENNKNKEGLHFIIEDDIYYEENEEIKQPPDLPPGLSEPEPDIDDEGV